ncbi:MAG: Eco57I restriction-modification methylase domain-containing protein [Phycisphaeraceae bacterium]
MPHTIDLELAPPDIARLTSADALAGLLDRLGYDTSRRVELTTQALGYTDRDKDIRHVELLAADSEDFLRIVFVNVRSITARVRNGLTRVLGRRSEDYLFILTADFDQLEFVLIDKLRHRKAGPGDEVIFKPVAKTFGVNRKVPNRLTLRILRRLTFTTADGLDQYSKIRHAFDSAIYSGRYFQNRALFADHYLESRLPDLPAWRDNPADAFATTQQLLVDARQRLATADEQAMGEQLYQPIFELLGFNAAPGKAGASGAPGPDYVLKAGKGRKLTAALVYRWDRWLDGPDWNDADNPDEIPGAAVVSLLEQGVAGWVIVTNGRLWRLYSAKAHSRSTNFYEVDLEEALLHTGGSDPNEAFRYWWLFFRRQAFEPVSEAEPAAEQSWLDFIAEQSRDYAKDVEDKLKRRVFEDVVPQLAAGFLADRRQRLGNRRKPAEAELEDIRQATLTMLYRVLFLLYAEARDLLPMRESPYEAISLARIKRAIADAAGPADSEADDKLRAAYKANAATLYDELAHLFTVMDHGDPAVNVPQYNGRLFWTRPPAADEEQGSSRDAVIARFLNEHKVPDRQLAIAIDRLARVMDARQHALVAVDYKSMGVRQLGSIYEGLLEYKLAIADEDLTTETARGTERYIPLSNARGGRTRRGTGVVVAKGNTYLTNDNAERKATGSYYTLDHIVQYIVASAVGPVLQEKLDTLRPAFRKAEQTYQRCLANAKANPKLTRASLSSEPRPPELYAQEQTSEKHRELVNELFNLRVLDPAMGSGHFLVEAVDFITDRVIDFLNHFPHNPVYTALEHTRRDIVAACAEQNVSLDPYDDRLNDVHLLKRHVLKRCIFGVDLNPLACELAKVSLWLDAFTLGAPLSFLDHHLRPGNSLIGASFADLKRATEGQLFGLDYEPMERAIRDVLFISRLADATAAEARQSADRYTHARQQLDTYRIVFDLLTAGHFGYPDAPEIVKRTKPDFTNYERFIQSLPKGDLPLVEAVEQEAAARRFFHWELEFPEVFFELGSAVGVKGSTQQLQELPPERRGFDVVVGNPPYDILSSLELGYDISDFQRWIADQQVYEPSRIGKNNLYKLFICRAFALLREQARLGFITPMAVLGDLQASGIRKMLIDHGAFTAVEAFPQKDDAERRVFPEAKLSTAIFIAIRANDQAVREQRFRSRVHPAGHIDPQTPPLHLSSTEIPKYDPQNLTIVSCQQADWDLATRIISSGRMKRLGDSCSFSQGEVNETVQRRKGNLTTKADGGVLVVRGAAICLYLVRAASQGEDLYLNRDAFLDGARPGSKAFDHEYPRVGVQESSAQNNFRRIIAAHVPKGAFCNHKVNYVPECDAHLPLRFALALLNSRLADWYFRLGSTNAAVSHYQLENLPCPVFASPDAGGATPSAIAKALERGDAEKVAALADKHIAQPPYPRWLLDVTCDVVERIIAIETARADMRRADRSALDPAAQPYQDLIDHLFYRMAGLSYDEARALEERLATML